jgi:hypothetical protein
MEVIDMQTSHTNIHQVASAHPREQRLDPVIAPLARGRAANQSTPSPTAKSHMT